MDHVIIKVFGAGQILVDEASYTRVALREPHHFCLLSLLVQSLHQSLDLGRFTRPVYRRSWGKKFCTKKTTTVYVTP